MVLKSFFVVSKKCRSPPKICLDPLHQSVTKCKKGCITATRETWKDTLRQHSDAYFLFDSFLSNFII